MKKLNFRNSTGSSLIETLIALLITAVGLLGVLSMQTKAVQLNQNASHYSQAAILANDMMETLRLFPNLSASDIVTTYGDHAGAAPDSCATALAGCNGPTNVAQWSRHHWKKNIENLLPEGEGQIERVGDLYRVKITFRIGYDSSGNAVRNNPPVELVARL